jgi:hypothetical protein
MNPSPGSPFFVWLMSYSWKAVSVSVSLSVWFVLWWPSACVRDTPPTTNATAAAAIAVSASRRMLVVLVMLSPSCLGTGRSLKDPAGDALVGRWRTG